MQQKQSALLVCGVLAALLSLPTTWMTLQGAQIQGGPGMMLNSMMGGMTIDVTGLNGHITFLFKTPIWFIACVAAAASGLQLLSLSKKVDVPRSVQWGTAIVAAAWVGIAFAIALFSGKATLGLGSLLGLISVALPLGCLITSRSADPSYIDIDGPVD